jgi:CheY-like chemotaxis protein
VSKRKLLLADDSITIQKVVNLTFADEGIEVISVGDGDSAMRKFDEFMPDLVMADVNMPGLTGYEVCRIIKQTEETQNIPVILLVGSFEPFDEEEARDAGADDFLTKPFQSIRQLVNKVTDLLNQRERRVAPAVETGPGAPVVDTFAETLEFEKQTAEPAEFGDAGMDDEMIEASPVNDYLSGASSEYQRETTIDYAKTQPLNAEDLKGFNIAQTGDYTGQVTSNEAAYEAPVAETTGGISGRAEPASFDEEARKLGEDYDESPNVSPENLSETEPQIDYYLPTGDEEEFEKELTDAETLEPDVSYTTAEPREADFSEAAEETAETSFDDSEETETTTDETADETVEAAPEFEETYETESRFAETVEETPYSAEEPETIDYRDPETVPESEAETETLAETDETPEPAESFDEEPQADTEAETAETTEESIPEESEEPEEFADAEEASEAEEPVEAEESAETEETSDAEETGSDSDETAEIDETPQTESEAVEETGGYAPANVPALNFDDGDLLELPPLVEETGIRPQAPVQLAAEPEPVAETDTAEPETVETPATETATALETAAIQSFPPELIEAIAQKVAEQISARTLSDVLPQITELVMKKLAEEKKE